MYDLTAFQRDLLYAIAGLPEPSGLEIKETLQEYYGEEITHGRLYQNLTGLDTKGLIHKGERDGRTNVYRLTPRGRRELQDRREWEQSYLGETISTSEDNGQAAEARA